MALVITNTDNITDNAALELDGASGVAAATHNGTTYLYVAGQIDDGVSTFEVAPDGTLTSLANIPDDAALRLTGATAAATASMNGRTFLFVAGFFDHGISVFEVDSSGALINTDNVVDDATLRLFTAQDVAAAQVGGTTYVFATGFNEDGVSVFALGADGRLTNVTNVVDDATLELDGSSELATAEVAGNTYLFATGSIDNGVSVFRVEANGALANVDNVSDDASLALAGAAGMTTAVVNGMTYLFVTGGTDDGVSVFSVAADGTLTNVHNVFDDATLGLDGAFAVTTALIGSTTYLFVIGRLDWAVAVFEVGADGTLTHVTNINDPALELDGAIDLTTAVVGATTYLFTTGHTDDGVSVFSLVDAAAPLTIVSDGGGDLANVAIAENTTEVTTVVAIDPNNSGPTYSIIGGIDAARFQIDSSTGVLSFVTAPDFEAPADDRRDNTYVVEVRASAGNQTDEQTITVEVTNVAEGGPGPGPTPNPGVNPGDLGLGDVLWRHSDGSVATLSHDLGDVGILWHIAETGDLDRDGDSDIIWRHRDGAVVAWEMEGGAYAIHHNLPNVADAWRLAASGDFDRDGDDDVLWHHRDGAVAVWEMEGGVYVINHNLPYVANTWQVEAAADFDRDGDADILWRHRDGAVVIWEMENGDYVVNHNLPYAGSLWQIAGAGDFDHDGDGDILWQHRDGAVVSWEIEGGAYVAHHGLPIVATSWQVAGTHDFDRDDDADILWHNDDGRVVTWEMQAGAFVVNHNFAAVATDWQIQGVGEFDVI